MDCPQPETLEARTSAHDPSGHDLRAPKEYEVQDKSSNCGGIEWYLIAAAQDLNLIRIIFDWFRH